MAHSAVRWHSKHQKAYPSSQLLCIPCLHCALFAWPAGVAHLSFRWGLVIAQQQRAEGHPPHTWLTPLDLELLELAGRQATVDIVRLNKCTLSAEWHDQLAPAMLHSGLVHPSSWDLELLQLAGRQVSLTNTMSNTINYFSLCDLRSVDLHACVID